MIYVVDYRCILVLMYPIIVHRAMSLVAKQLTSILHVSHFFSLKSMNRLDFIICWFSIYLKAEKSIKIFFYEIKLGEKK